MKGILGRKVGMTEVFTKEGKVIPVTVIEVEKNTVMQVKTVENDGYNAIQLGVCDKKEKNATKASIGHAKKANTNPKRFLKEIRDYEGSYNLGDTIGSMGTMRPMRVLPGKALPGHMGCETVTIQNLVVVEANPAENYILVSGNVPGAKQSLVLIKSAAKNERKAENNELVSYETVVDSVANDDTEAKEENQEN